MATTEDFTSLTNGSTNDTYYYNYADEYEDELCVKADIRQFQAIFYPVFFSIMVILSLFGNILVIVILVKYENLKSLTNTFILNLAVSDLFFTAGLPFWAYYYMYGWTLGEPACKIAIFIFYFGFYSSGILLILMTAHRYVAVMNPLSNIVSATGLYSLLTCVAVWVVSILITAPAVIAVQVEQNHCTFSNSFWSLWGIYQQNILFIVSSLVFIFCYSQIMCRLLRPTAQRRRRKTLKLIFTLMVVFFVGWAPYNIAIFLNSMYRWGGPPVKSNKMAAECEKSNALDYAVNVSQLLAFSHCFLNPIFYVFVGVKFKTHLKKMLKGLSHRNGSSRSSGRSRVTHTSSILGEDVSSRCGE